MNRVSPDRCCSTRVSKIEPPSEQANIRVVGNDTVSVSGKVPTAIPSSSYSHNVIPVGPPLSLSGPQWTGPLHDRGELEAMRQEAEARGWLGHDFDIENPYSGAGSSGESSNSDSVVYHEPGARLLEGVASSEIWEGVSEAADGQEEKRRARPSLARTKKSAPLPLGELLGIMVDEADARLPPGFIAVDRVGRHLASNPARDKLIAALRAGGFAASRCHLDPRSLRTSARMVDILGVCQDALGIKVRPDSTFALLQ